jgi:3-hydroxy-9,10-secoandrosta-1,3,5(10)-triene-9,17-dione monooxygenase reductase component
VSLEPPLVLFCVRRSSGTWSAIEASGRFCASILADDQEDVCRVFASQSDDKFAGIGWRRSEGGSPVIDGALAWVDCTVHDVVDAGDHHVVIGAVSGLDVAREGSPLLFFRSGYGRFGQ